MMHNDVLAVVKILLAWQSSLDELGECWVAEALVEVTGLMGVLYVLAYTISEAKTTLIELYADDFGKAQYVKLIKVLAHFL